MIYIQVYVPDKNRFFDYKVSRKINICNLKSLIVESIYNVKCDDEFIKCNYVLMDFNCRKRLKDDVNLYNYPIYNGYKFLLI